MFLIMRDRPAAAGFVLLAAGAEIGCFPLGQPSYLALQGLGGAAALCIAVALVTCAVHMWLHPARAVRSGWAAIAASILSYPFANLGGFFVGMLLALLGGALACGPGSPHPVTSASGGSRLGSATRWTFLALAIQTASVCAAPAPWAAAARPAEPRAPVGVVGSTLRADSLALSGLYCPPLPTGPAPNRSATRSPWKRCAPGSGSAVPAPAPRRV